MKTRKIGTLELSGLGSGCKSISANYGPPADRHQGITVIREAHEKGVTSFDARSVQAIHQRRSFGEALAPFRNRVRIATKFGFDIEAGGLNSRPDHIKKVVEGSLKRLRTDRIDLCYQHRVDPHLTDSKRWLVQSRTSSSRARCCTSASPRRVRKQSAERTRFNR